MPADQIRNRTVGSKMTDSEYEKLAGVAEQDGQTLGEWCREVLLERAEGRKPQGPVRVDHIGLDMANLPAFGDQRQIGNPPAGVSDILDLYLNNPNMTRVSNTNLQVAPEWTVAFHELAEAYEKIDGGKGGSYAAGHNAALQREMTLRDQRPYLKQYNTGAGGPANSPNPQGGIIIKK